jgi:hypothetical protein
MYYLYSIRYQGWVSTSANYTSDLTEAAKFDEAEALNRASKTKTEHSLGVIPVSVALMEKL